MRTMTGSITLPRVPLRFIAVAAAHVGLFYVVTDALRLNVQPERERIEGHVLPMTPFPDTAPPETPELVVPKAVTVDRFDPPPRVDYEDAPDKPVEHVRTTSTAGVGERPVGRSELVARFVPVRADADSPLTRAPYPVASIRLEEEGVVELAIHVLRHGRIADVRVARSSGYPRLDRAAVDEARRNWRLQPAMQGDVRVDAWGSFRVVFRLDGRR